jgi:ubiquinone/menaquinone biosynthesis C-methylase UbiE
MPADEALWRTYSRVYDEVLNVIPYRNLLLELVDRLEIKPGVRVLDAGCGTANLLWALSHQSVSCEITGVDSSKAMLAKAREKHEKYGGIVRLVFGDLCRPPSDWAGEVVFDRIIMNNSLWVMPDPAACLESISRASMPNARIVISTPRPNPNVNELLEEHLQLSENSGIGREEALQRMLPLLQPVIRCNEALMKRYGDSGHLPSEPVLRKWLTEAGWTIEDLTTSYAGQNWLVVATKASSQ